MTLQELLKNDEDKRSDHGGKSGEWLADGDSMRWWQCLSVAAVTCSSRCRWHHSITVSVTGKTGQWHHTQISLLECLLLKSITDSLAHLTNECVFRGNVCIFISPVDSTDSGSWNLIVKVRSDCLYFKVSIFNRYLKWYTCTTKEKGFSLAINWKAF